LSGSRYNTLGLRTAHICRLRHHHNMPSVIESKFKTLEPLIIPMQGNYWNWTALRYQTDENLKHHHKRTPTDEKRIYK